MHINVEIKAKSSDSEKIRKILKEQHAEFKGIDNQTDTYFNVNNGRLKLRESNIENHLIFYKRQNIKEPKQSDVLLFKTNPESELKNILTQSLGILATIVKSREIYFIDNVKFHIDNVQSLGDFVEIEAIGKDNFSKEKLTEQCNFYLNLFKIQKDNLISESYSDMILGKKND